MILLYILGGAILAALIVSTYFAGYYRGVRKGVEHTLSELRKSFWREP